jgi:hypothetical protein
LSHQKKTVEKERRQNNGRKNDTHCENETHGRDAMAPAPVAVYSGKDKSDHERLNGHRSGCHNDG